MSVEDETTKRQLEDGESSSPLQKWLAGVTVDHIKYTVLRDQANLCAIRGLENPAARKARLNSASTSISNKRRENTSYREATGELEVIIKDMNLALPKDMPGHHNYALIADELRQARDAIPRSD